MREAYPGASLYPDEHGVWLFARSLVLEDIGREAIFLIALPDYKEVEPRGWAAWDTGKSVSWIGDRHTNFFDGSVCAYANAIDDAWWPGDDLRTLLDLYSLWAFRHLHLEMIGRWPGRQHALLDQHGRPDPYYRLIEFHDDELCSCGVEGSRYGSCCKPWDIRHDFLKITNAFKQRQGGRSIRDRLPPDSVMDFMRDQGSLPAIIDVHEPLQQFIRVQKAQP